MRILIVDDEAAARQQNRNLLHKHFPEHEVCAEAALVSEAYQEALIHNPDLVLLDVDMPDGSAFDFLQKLTSINFSIIFITAYEKYALQAIKFSALDYLLKPYSEGEFVDAIRKAVRKSGEMETGLQIKTLMQNMQQDTHSSRLVLRTSDSIHVVALDEIVRLQADGAYTSFFIHNRKQVVVSKNLKEYDSLLEKSGFLRTHQSHLVNLRFVVCFHKQDGGSLGLSDGTQVPVATRYKEKVLGVIARI